MTAPYNMPTERPIPKDYIERNKRHWQNTERGRVSRPMELPRIGNLVSTSIQSTFAEYGIGEITKPIFTFAVFTDKPKTPSSSFVYQERYPDEIAQEDKQNFGIGISRMNEYAANYATKEFFRKNADVPVFKQTAGLYGEVADLVTYGILLRGTSSRMQNIELLANYYGLDYKHALLTALFNHDTSELDNIISIGSDLNLYNYSNVNQMAVEIGRKRLKRPDIGKWFDKLDANRNDGKVKTAVKNGVLSTAALGVYRNPGVVETHGAIIPASPVIAGIGCLALTESLFLAGQPLAAIQHPEHINLIIDQLPSIIPLTTAAMVSTALFVTPFVVVHEGVHHFSADETHLGLIPTTLIQKDTTPYKARLESLE